MILIRKATFEDLPAVYNLIKELVCAASGKVARCRSAAVRRICSRGQGAGLQHGQMAGARLEC